MIKPTFAGRSASSMQKSFMNEGNGTGFYHFATRNTLDGFLSRKRFIPGLITQINWFFSDQQIFGLYQSTKIFFSVGKHTKCFSP